MAKSRNMLCIVDGCPTRTARPKNGRYPSVTRFSLPKNPSRKIEWLKKCSKYDIIQRVKDGNPVTSYKLCCLHFNEKMFSNSKKTRLTLNAIPTIFNCSPSIDKKFSLNESPTVAIENQPGPSTSNGKNKEKFCPASMIMCETPNNEYPIKWVCQLCIKILLSVNAVHNHLKTCFLSKGAVTDNDHGQVIV